MSRTASMPLPPEPFLLEADDRLLELLELARFRELAGLRVLAGFDLVDRPRFDELDRVEAVRFLV